MAMISNLKARKPRERLKLEELFLNGAAHVIELALQCVDVLVQSLPHDLFDVCVVELGAEAPEQTLGFVLERAERRARDVVQALLRAPHAAQNAARKIAIEQQELRHRGGRRD